MLATGARHAYFGHDDWEPSAPGLKTLEDATTIRGRILIAFERAEQEPNETKRAALMTFVIVGAGPTGVELAGTIAELARATLPADFRNIDMGKARIVLIEAGRGVRERDRRRGEDVEVGRVRVILQVLYTVTPTTMLRLTSGHIRTACSDAPRLGGCPGIASAPYSP